MGRASGTTPLAVITLQVGQLQPIVERTEVTSARRSLNVVKKPFGLGARSECASPLWRRYRYGYGPKRASRRPNVLKARTAAVVDSTGQAYQNF